MVPQVYIAWSRLENITGHEMGRRLLAELHQTYVGGEMPEIVIAPKGKPYFADGRWHFSISHTKRHAFCILSDTPVGIDAEEMDRKVAPHIQQKILSPSEWAQVSKASVPDIAFLHIWVLKEATAKASGEGIRIHPSQTDFSLEDPRVRQIDGCLVAVVLQNTDFQEEPYVI